MPWISFNLSLRQTLAPFKAQISFGCCWNWTLNLVASCMHLVCVVVVIGSWPALPKLQTCIIKQNTRLRPQTVEFGEHHHPLRMLLASHSENLSHFHCISSEKYLKWTVITGRVIVTIIHLLSSLWTKGDNSLIHEIKALAFMLSYCLWFNGTCYESHILYDQCLQFRYFAWSKRKFLKNVTSKQML